MKTHNFALLLTSGALFLVLCGCMTTKSQLQSVNKDWNKMIRACHIYPIYPLSQDIQPGDIYLVSNDIEDLAAWDQDGYLKLDHLVSRLNLPTTDYASFYTNSFAFDETNKIPNRWMKNNSWTNAPVAAFPSYSFALNGGAGFNVALPIEGIPIGLGLMETKSASGYVTLGDSLTYGIDELTLLRRIHSFLQDSSEQLFDLIGESQATNTHFLQIVTRVYFTSKVSVSLINDSALGGTASGGSPKDVYLPLLDRTNSVSNYTSLVNAVNSMMSASNALSSATEIIPGGTLKFSFVSSRSVSMQETFPKPIAIGYLAFTVPIFVKSGGTKGPSSGFVAGPPQSVETTIRAIRHSRKNQ